MLKNNYPDDWSRLRIKELTQRFLNGGTPSTHIKEHWGGNIPWITGADAEQRLTTTSRKSITELGVRRSSTNIVPKGNILLVTRTGVGKVSMSGVDVAISQDLTGIIPRVDKVDVPYLYYQLIRIMADLKSLSQGSIIQGIKREEVENIEIPLPELPEQRAIADILSTLDEAIAQSESLVRKYQSIKQGLMSDLLTRGVDENGELRPSYEEAPELYRATALGWLPKDWEVLTIRDARKSITSGSRWWAKYYADEGALFLRIGNLTREHINLRFDSIQRVRVPNDAESKRTAVAAGDVLISVTADLGIIGVIPENFEEAYVNQHIALVKVDAEITNSRWLGHFMASRLGWYQFQTLNDSGAKAGLNLPTVDSLSFANPSKDERKQIVKMIDNQDDMIKVEKGQVTKLQLLKQGLMQDLLSGQVRVKV